MNQLIRTGLVGYGLGGRSFHAPFIATHPGFELVSVVERTSNLSQERFPDAQVVRSFEDMLTNASLDLLVITTPNATHFPFALQALEAGKHVVVDKPITITSAEAKELMKKAEETGKVLSVYQNRRYTSDFKTIRKILRQDLLGPVHEYEAQYNRYRLETRAGWKESDEAGGGILYDLGPHIIDQALVLFGLPRFITADIRKQRPGVTADDYFDIRLDFDSVKVTLKAGMMVREQGPRYMIHGLKGSFIKYGDDPQEIPLRNNELPVGDQWGMEPEELYGLLHTEINGKPVRERVPSEQGHFGAFYTNLYETIVNGAPLVEKPEHGYNTVRIIERAYESHTKKCTLECTGLIDAYA